MPAVNEECPSPKRAEPKESQPGAVDVVRAYHQRTEHHLHRYAAGPDSLDWDERPCCFRRYEGAATIALPPLSEARRILSVHLDQAMTYDFQTQQPQAVAEANLVALSALLGLSLGITAWKSLGPDRWAVRANPSSGNLHPVEAYFCCDGAFGLAAGVYHYRPEDHSLELRALWSANAERRRAWIALTTVPWRETWKYGERSFRYCQLDTGHAMASVSVAAAALGWHVCEHAIASNALAHLLGLDRVQDFPRGRRVATEHEEPEVVLELKMFSEVYAPVINDDFQTASRHALFFGRANVIDAHPMYAWPLIAEVLAATRTLETRTRAVADEEKTARALTLQLPRHARERSVAEVILSRRSAQAFSGRAILSGAAFTRLLQSSCSPGVFGNTISPAVPHIALVLWVHRVESLGAGLYAFTRSTSRTAFMSHLSQEFSLAAVIGDPFPSGLYRLASVAPRALAAQARLLHCHQRIAADSCFTLGMFVEFDQVGTRCSGQYRDVLRQAGRIGHSLYLGAELERMRATAIGCFFDSAVRDVLKLQGTSFRSVYHLSVGQAIDDPRIETTAPYPQQ